MEALRRTFSPTAGVLALAVGLLLLGYPGAAQTIAEATACTTGIYNSPGPASLRPHVPHNPINATAAQLSDQSYPTPPEIAAIRTIYPRLQDCREQTVAALSKTLPGVVRVAERLQAAGQEDLRLLLERQSLLGSMAYALP